MIGQRDESRAAIGFFRARPGKDHRMTLQHSRPPGSAPGPAPGHAMPYIRLGSGERGTFSEVTSVRYGWPVAEEGRAWSPMKSLGVPGSFIQDAEGGPWDGSTAQGVRHYRANVTVCVV